MIIFLALLLTTLQIQHLYSTEVTTLRGVSLTKNVFYNPEKQFTCLDGSLTIPFQYVNDDYCDCNDGTDEPGTSACPNGVFHCANEDHKPLNIPSSRVNDGICDCCDASDEYNSSANCVNFCRELGQKAREEDRRLLELALKGLEIKQLYAKKGKELKEERKAKLIELEKKRDELRKIKDEREAVKNTQEEFEKEAIDKFNEVKEFDDERDHAEQDERNMFSAFIDLDVDQNGKLTLDEIKSHWFFDQDKDGVVTTEEAKFFLINKYEMDMDEYKKAGWALIRPQYTLHQMFKSPEDVDGDPEIDISPPPPPEKPKIKKEKSGGPPGSIFDEFDEDKLKLEEKADIHPSPVSKGFGADRLAEEFLKLKEHKVKIKRKTKLKPNVPHSPVFDEFNPDSLKEEFLKLKDEQERGNDKLDISLPPPIDDYYPDEFPDDLSSEEESFKDDDDDYDEEMELERLERLKKRKFRMPPLNRDMFKPPTAAPTIVYDEETQAVIDSAEKARTELREAEFKFKNAESEVEKCQRLLATDFGPEEEFGSLHEQCFDYKDREYTYTLCFFDKATQKTKSDRNTVNLGTWGDWVEAKNYSKMKYENGLECFDGPKRTAEVRLTCGYQTQIIRVSEPERCKYLFEVTTPATCSEASKQTDPHAHEEL